MIKAGAAKVDITPQGSVWMDGMIREHKSEGIHDPLWARVLVLSDGDGMQNAFAIMSMDVCAISVETAQKAKQVIASATGIPATNIIIAATHTHSGPATVGYFNDAEVEYVDDLVSMLSKVASEALHAMRPAALACASGREDTISFYRRFADKDGNTVMIWEQDPSKNDFQVLGEPDPEVGVLKVVDASDPKNVISVLFNHAGHPNVMSGENFFLSADYPGAAMRAVEEKFGGVAIFMNGAQGTMDIDNWTYRDWDGVEHLGRVLADAVVAITDQLAPSQNTRLRGSSVSYAIPARQISDEELAWADDILASTGGKIVCMADGVGDDYKAKLYKELRATQENDVKIEQTGIAIGDTAFITFPGELFTEIGMRIKAESPFERTYIFGLTNGCIGYVPAIKSVPQGGYEVDTREVCAEAEDMIVERSLELLNELR